MSLGQKTDHVIVRVRASDPHGSTILISRIQRKRAVFSEHLATRLRKTFVQFLGKSGSIDRISLMSPDSTRLFEDRSASQQMFLSLFLRSEREIFRYVAVLVPNVSDAEDIVQQTAIALWEKFDAYDQALPFTPWACRFALNKTRQWIERRQRWQALLEGGLAEELAQRREELRPELEGRLKHLEGCLGKLPEDQRSLVEGYYCHRTEIEALSERSGRTVAATYKALQRIRQALLICVQRAGQPEGAG
jgi:RNA polymerase sigma-70 factor, ECF subfamily